MNKICGKSADTIVVDDFVDAATYMNNSPWFRPQASPEDAKFIANIRERVEALKSGTRMLLSIIDARRLTAFIDIPMYRGRNKSYVSFEPYQIRKWVEFGEKKIAAAVASKFDLR